MKHPTNPIYFIERNIHGAWVIYGIAGVKQYYYYTKKQATNLYKQLIDNAEVKEETYYIPQVRKVLVTA